jgi:hypothetical protein
MSPEQIAGKRVDGRSDLYSLGVMLFQMLTGVLPFRGDSMAELMYKIANEEAPDIRIIRKDVSERLANIVALALSKRPETRYQDGDQLAADLRSVLGEQAAAPMATAARTAAAPATAPAGPAGDADKTVVMAARVPAGAQPSYDSGAQPAGGATDTFDKTAVIRNPGGPATGSDKNDSET